MKKILIIGDSPKFNGGVTNYTRPLAQKLSDHCDVYYLFNSTRVLNNSFFKKRGIYEVYKDEYNFKSFQLINGKSVYKNYNHLENDYSDWMNELISSFLDKIKPDVVHINEFFGFSADVFRQIKDRNIKLIVTVHEYWWLCPKRVMVDFNNRICSGPENFSKCSFCISKVKSKNSVEKEIFTGKLKNIFPNTIDKIIALKNRNNEDKSFQDLSFNNLSFNDFSNITLENNIKKRFEAIIGYLNICDIIIGVSSDVKSHLLKYGVQENRIIVQHIGSSVADKKTPHTKVVNEKEIIFGFIGGVSYYKGVHQMVESFTKIPGNLKKRAKLAIYGKYEDSYVNSIKRDFMNSDIDNTRIEFFGKFTPEDLQEITNSMDINILPSLCADTAPQTIFESFSAGLPIIAPKVGGFPDFVKDNVNGLLYEKASVEDLRIKMIEVIENPKLIDDFAKNITESKSMKKNIEELLKLYN